MTDESERASVQDHEEQGDITPPQSTETEREFAVVKTTDRQSQASSSRKSLKGLDEKSIEVLLAKFMERQRRRMSKKVEAKKLVELKVEPIRKTESSEEDEESQTDSYAEEDDDGSQSESDSSGETTFARHEDTYSDNEEKALIRQSMAKQSCLGINGQYRCNYTDAYLQDSAHKNKGYGMKLFYRNMRKRLNKRHEIIENDRGRITDLSKKLRKYRICEKSPQKPKRDKSEKLEKANTADKTQLKE